MDKTASALVVLVAAFLFLAFIITFVVWISWPVLGNAFPGLVAAGYIAPELTLWQSFWVAVLSSVLFKGTCSSSSSS